MVLMVKQRKDSPRLKFIKTVLTLVVAMMVLICPSLAHDHCFGFEQVSPPNAGKVKGPMDFESCVKFALEKSPCFSQSAIEIDVRRLDESDSKWSYSPSLTLRTNTYMGLDDGNGTKLRLAVDSYDPVSPYFSIKASKILTEIAVQMHLKYISDGVYDIAVKILELEGLDRMARRQDKILAYYREKKAFFERLQQTGLTPQMEGRLAGQQLDVAQAEREALSVQSSAIMGGLSTLLGLDSPQELEINLKDSRRQILEGFEPKAFAVEHARSNCHELKVQELKKQLQTYRIYLAYAKFFPTIFVGMEEPGPLSTREGEDYYIDLGLNLNLWRGFKDVNDLSRQKMILTRFKNEARLKETEFNVAWDAAHKEMLRTETALRLARSNEKLARIESSQMQIFYNSNEQPLSKLLDSKIARLRAEKGIVSKATDNDMSRLKIRYLSGDLFNSYVSVEDTEGRHVD